MQRDKRGKKLKTGEENSFSLLVALLGQKSPAVLSMTPHCGEVHAPLSHPWFANRLPDRIQWLRPKRDVDSQHPCNLSRLALFRESITCVIILSSHAIKGFREYTYYCNWSFESFVELLIQLSGNRRVNVLATRSSQPPGRATPFSEIWTILDSALYTLGFNSLRRKGISFKYIFPHVELLPDHLCKAY